MTDEAVVVIEAENEPPADDTTVVVVESPVEPAGDAVEAVVVEAAIDHAIAIGALAERVTAIENRLGDVEFDTEIADNKAEVALNVAFEATDVAIGVGESVAVTNENVDEIAEEEDIEIDNPPNPLPWTHRAFSSLFGSK